MSLPAGIDLEVPLPDGAPAGTEGWTETFPETGYHYRIASDGRLFRRRGETGRPASLRTIPPPISDPLAPEDEVFVPHLGLVGIHVEGRGVYTAAFLFGRLLGVRAGDVRAWTEAPPAADAVPVMLDHAIDGSLHEQAESPSTHWNYRLVRWSCGSVALHEVYYRDGEPEAVTLAPIDFVVGDDEEPEGLRRSLRLALADAGTRPVLDATAIPGCADHVLTGWGAMPAAEAPGPLPLGPAHDIRKMARERGWLVAEALRIAGFPEDDHAGLLSGERRIDAADAERLGTLFGTGPARWLNRQAAHDRLKAEHDLRQQRFWLKKRREAEDALRRPLPEPAAETETFCVQVGGASFQELALSAAEVADAWHRAEKGERVVPSTRISYPSWPSLAQALRDTGLDAQIPNPGRPPVSELAVDALRSLGVSIVTDADYAEALREIDGLMDAESGTPEARRLNILAGAVHAYETRHHGGAGMGTEECAGGGPARDREPSLATLLQETPRAAQLLANAADLYGAEKRREADLRFDDGRSEEARGDAALLFQISDRLKASWTEAAAKP